MSTGSPIWFHCRRARQGHYHAPDDRVRLTGRTRPFRSKKGTAIGTRSVFTSYEYECDCGYVGWSNHMDLARKARDTPALARRGYLRPEEALASPARTKEDA